MGKLRRVAERMFDMASQFFTRYPQAARWLKSFLEASNNNSIMTQLGAYPILSYCIVNLQSFILDKIHERRMDIAHMLVLYQTKFINLFMNPFYNLIFLTSRTKLLKRHTGQEIIEVSKASIAFGEIMS